MRKKQLDITRIKNFEGKVVPTSDIKSLGFLPYDLKKLEEENYLIKLKRGYYYCNPEQNDIDLTKINYEIEPLKRKGNRSKVLDLSELEVLDGETITTADLKDLGFHHYDIKRLESDGTLYKIRQGHFYINTKHTEIDKSMLVSLTMHEAKRGRKRKERDISKLEDKDEKIISTSDLKTLGYDRNDINVLLDEKYLVKIKKGYYLVNVTKKEINNKLLKSFVQEKPKKSKKGKLDISKLEELDRQTVSASKLKEIGYDQNHLTSLVKDGYLIRKNFGIYYVNYQRRQINSRVLEPMIIELENNIKEHNFKQAYYTLLNMSKKKVDNSYDQYILIYSTLLKPLLGSKIDFSFVEKLNPTPANIDERLLAISNDILKEMSNILTNTLEEKELLEEKKRKFNTHYANFNKSIAKEEYVNALNDINRCLDYAYNEASLDASNILRSLLLTIINIQSGHKVKLPKTSIDYGDYSNPTTLIKRAVEEKDYMFAYKIINEHNMDADKNLYRVIKNILEKIINYKKDEIVANQDKQSIDTAYKLFLTSFYKNNYVKAMEQLKFIVEKQGEDKTSKEYRIYTLLKSYEKMVKEKLMFASKKIDYTNMTTLEIFEHALDNQDYRVALKNIGKLTYQNDDQLLEIYKIILHKMYDVHKVISDKKAEEERKKLYPKPTGPVFSSINDVVTNISKEKITQEDKAASKVMIPQVKLEEEQLGKAPVAAPVNIQKKELKERVSLSYNQLYDMIQDEKYEELYEVIAKATQNHEKTSREEFVVYRLIKILLDLRDGKTVNPTNGHLTDCTNDFKCFFQSVNFRNISDIKYYYDVCYSIAREKEELDLYKKLIDDILDAEQALKEKEEIKARVPKIDNEIKEILDKKNNLTNEEIDKLYELMNYKVVLGSEANDIALSILYTIDLVNNKYVEGSYINYVSVFDLESFASFEANEKIDEGENPLTGREDKEELIINLLKNGDYIKAYQILQSGYITNTLKEYSYSDKIIIKSLLKILNSITNTPWKEKEEVQEEVPVVEEKREYEDLLRLIKKRDFYGAYSYAMESSLDKNTLENLLPELFILYHDDVSTESELATDFDNSIEAKDLNQARIDLINYKELLDRTSMGKSDKYQAVLSGMNKKYIKAKER